MRVRPMLYGAVLCVCVVPILPAQDAAKVDSKHYSVVTDNSQVRILKVHYGPHEKSVMHSHPAAVAVFLTDAKGKFTFAEGKTQEFAGKAGDSQYAPATVHLPENTSDQAMDLIVVELKSKPGAKAMANKTEKK
jgi:quercetin dioxygenase-like cupin family protein